MKIAMRIQNKIVLWPVYFDANKTRIEGRKIPKKIATPAPTLEEIQKAVERIGFQLEIVPDAIHPRFSWRKTGLLVIPKKFSKVKTLRKIAKELKDIRG